MQPDIEFVEGFTVVGLAIESTMENDKNLEDSPKVKKDFMDRKSEIDQIKNEKTLYTICWPSDEKDSMKYKYMACYEVVPDNDTPDGMTKVTIPEGEYAVFTHKGTQETINKTWEIIFRSMLPSGYSFDWNGISFRRFYERFTTDDDSETNIYVPVILS